MRERYLILSACSCRWVRFFFFFFFKKRDHTEIINIGADSAGLHICVFAREYMEWPSPPPGSVSQVARFHMETHFLQRATEALGSNRSCDRCCSKTCELHITHCKTVRRDICVSQPVHHQWPQTLPVGCQGSVTVTLLVNEMKLKKKKKIKKSSRVVIVNTSSTAPQRCFTSWTVEHILVYSETLLKLLYANLSCVSLSC